MVGVRDGIGYEHDERAVDCVAMGQLTARRPAQRLAAQAVVIRPEALDLEKRLEARVSGARLTVTISDPQRGPGMPKRRTNEALG